MDTEAAFQQWLDEHPDDHTARLVFADWLEEQGDPRAVGYRALGERRVVPCGVTSWVGPGSQYREDRTGILHYARASRAKHLAKTFSDMGDAILAAALPDDWCESISTRAGAEAKKWNWESGWCGYLPRRQVEDAAALAYSPESATV